MTQEDLARLCRRLDEDCEGLPPRGVSLVEAQAVIAAAETHVLRGTEPEAARVFAERLVTLCPMNAKANARIFADTLTATLAAYPLDYVARVCDPLKGLPARQTFPLCQADVVKALDGEAARRARILANAHWIVRREEERRAAAQEEERFRAARPDAARRAAIVKEAMARFKFMGEEG